MSLTKSKNSLLIKTCTSGLMLALAFVLPFITAGNPQLGNMLLPMHLPVLICGFACGPVFGAAVGFIAPLLRFAILHMPPTYLIAVPMAFELAAYGLFSGLLYGRLKIKRPANIYLSLVLSMLLGRGVWGIAKLAVLGFSVQKFPFSAFLAGALTSAVPGIVLQLVLVPLLVMTLERLKFIK